MIRNWCESNYLAFNTYDDNFIKPTSNITKEFEKNVLDKQIKDDDKDNLRNIELDISGLVKLRKN